MESQPQNTEFRNNPENCHPCMEKLEIRAHRKDLMVMHGKVEGRNKRGVTVTVEWGSH